eukprot:CAMPEP_0196576044 /NCGR_PEP_ID=MMETSP1081-20130531/5402_1 /TAXON_ID=36882 /ORGANISM="Pyramimonas amylifera, Strain CCMP720" /LENGTH=448 /DNA_ID=CAMNT_0041894539 /DNA_START=80 /DNA_END=1426 /DNA_ORIENTATION=+
MALKTPGCPPALHLSVFRQHRHRATTVTVSNCDRSSISNPTPFQSKPLQDAPSGTSFISPPDPSQHKNNLTSSSSSGCAHKDTLSTSVEPEDVSSNTLSISAEQKTPFSNPKNKVVAKSPFFKSTKAKKPFISSTSKDEKFKPHSPFSSPRSSRDPFATSSRPSESSAPSDLGPGVIATSAVTSVPESTIANRNPENESEKPLDGAHVFPVPEELQDPARPPVTQHVSFYSLEELFPGTGLANKFDTNAQFRADLHQAARDDLFVPSPKFSAEVNDRIKSAGSTLCVAWTLAEKQACGNITKLFSENGILLDGNEFVLKLGELIQRGGVTTGSLTDIVDINKHVNHSWHQDSGLDQVTLMMGYPSENEYTGPGVFSHVVKLSHSLKQIGREGEVIEYEKFKSAPLSIPEKYILRPVYSKGKEVMVYNDSSILHSAPDFANRKAVWRFM